MASSSANLRRLSDVCSTIILTFKIHQERSVHLITELRSNENLLGQAAGPAGEGLQRVRNWVCLL